jgi:2-polyprenyl-6-methoxyphenol hydroxylase-like FAD-dependent oxidoreductase
VMLGYLLARAGVKVTVLEKHEDFFRDFRGDTVHPSTLEVMAELGLLDELLQIPHRRVTSVRASFGDESLQIADLRQLPVRCPYVALMPQWDFLNFLSRKAASFPAFELRTRNEATDLIRDNGRVCGVEVQTPEGVRRIGADLVVGCDGRHSRIREAAALPVEEVGVPIDVLWFRISRNESDPEPEHVIGKINYGKVLILLDRGSYFQVGMIIRKDSFPQIKQEGIEAFRNTVARIAPDLAGRVGELEDWGQVKLLSVQINRLRRWHRPGVLCIGDAAHAMSPAFGVGINLAVQDAVATARLLAAALRSGRCDDDLLHAVQRRRSLPTWGTQLLQVLAHKGMEYVFAHDGPVRPPAPLKFATHIPGFQRTVARVIGIGIRPEHATGVPEYKPVRVNWLRRTVAVCAAVATAGTVLWRRTFA